jgi:pyridoxine/pyridoxamine 5'-phosphate oxidase
MPLWGVWLDGAFYFGTDRRSRKARNLAANPALVVHLESGDDTVILEGRAQLVSDATLLSRIDDAYLAKYRLRLLGHPGELGVYRLRPQLAFAWREKDFNRSATRWRFEAER